MKKQAVSPQVLAKILSGLKSPAGRKILQTAAGSAAGAGVGGTLGYYVTPHIMGYEDVPKARRISAYGDAIAGALIGGKGSNMGWRKAVNAFKGLPLAKQLGWGSALVAAEAPPILAANQIKQREAAELSGTAAKQFGEASKSMSIPNAISDVVRSGGLRGAVAGAGAAGLAGMLTGMFRPKDRVETEEDHGRTEMMRRDALRYLLPAMVAGGVIGSMRGRGKR